MSCVYVLTYNERHMGGWVEGVNKTFEGAIESARIHQTLGKDKVPEYYVPNFIWTEDGTHVWEFNGVDNYMIEKVWVGD